jgi:hypothetical protein
VFGKIIDTTCILWRESCGTVGECALYDIDDMRFKMVTVDVVMQVIAIGLAGAALLICRLQNKTGQVKTDKN